MLTTRQRDLLQILINTETPVGAADLADRLQLSPRQVNYDLQRLDGWLTINNASLVVQQGVGVSLDCQDKVCQELQRKLDSEKGFQLVLTADERRQILAFNLLITHDPFIVAQFEQGLAASRSTVLKDLSLIEEWLAGYKVALERRPNYGIRLRVGELHRRSLIAQLIWGDAPFGNGLFKLDHTRGFAFSLAEDASLLPLVEKADAVMQGWDVTRSFTQVAFAEAQLDGRFTDDAVLYLALALAIQVQRAKQGCYVTVEPDLKEWLAEIPLWHIANHMLNRISWGDSDKWPADEIASIAMHIVAVPRNQRWPGDLELDAGFTTLIDAMMTHVGQAYEMPRLANDRTLRDGFVNHIIPACLRRRFNLWLPALAPGSVLAEDYRFEHTTAWELAKLVQSQADVTLPKDEVANMALLLRAAYIRERPSRKRRIVVVCPSGMATTQLLVARIRARFPHLEITEVLSVRELLRGNPGEIDLIISTVDLPPGYRGDVDVLRVHPLLLPEDIEALTHWLS